jgi:chromosome segregation ATPase
MSKIILTIVKLAFGLAFVIVGYNYFLGDAAEKESSREIIGQVKVLTGSVVDLLKTEKGKYDKGKYDNAMDKLKDTFSVLKEKAAAMGESGEATLDKLSALEQRRKDLEDQLAELNMDPGSVGGVASRGEDDEADLQESAESIRQEILQLNSELEDLALDTQLPPP